jgi:hypothetical protein
MDMHPVFMSVGCFTLLSATPVPLLFRDDPGLRGLHIPLLYSAVLIVTFAAVLPWMLAALGLWTALLAPVVVFVYASSMGVGSALWRKHNKG